jgi:hypothetical protein
MSNGFQTKREMASDKLKEGSMTQEIIDMAQECGLIGMRPHLDGIYTEALVAFYKLAVAKERAACARVCDAFQARDVGMQPAECAGAIRARGQA